MSEKLLLGLFAGLLASIGAHASVDLSYNYVQVEYVSVEIDNGVLSNYSAEPKSGQF